MHSEASSFGYSEKEAIEQHLVQSFITEEFKEQLQAEADAHHKNISSTSGPNGIASEAY